MRTEYLRWGEKYLEWGDRENLGCGKKEVPRWVSTEYC